MIGPYLLEGIGNADFYVMNDEKVATIVCNCKATQDLLLPMLAQECVIKYNEAYMQMNESQRAHANGLILFIHSAI
jgi:hypothetical protein